MSYKSIPFYFKIVFQPVLILAALLSEAVGIYDEDILPNSQNGIATEYTLSTSSDKLGVTSTDAIQHAP